MNFFAKAGARIIEKTEVFRGWNRVHRMILDYTSSDGTTVRLTREVIDHGNAAAILLYDPERDVVVLVRQFRMGTFYLGQNPFVLEAAAGLLDGDEPEAAVRREALEETGYRVERLIPLFPIFGSIGALAEEVHLFVGLVDVSSRVSRGGGLADEHEDIEVVEVPLAEALAMVDAGQMPDAKTVILLQWLRSHQSRLKAED